MIRNCIVVIVIFVTITGSVFAQTDSIFASYTYTMGDNDTKSDARQLCFLYAKRQCLEKAGTFVQSEMKIHKEQTQNGAIINYSELTQQDISTFAGAFVKVDIVSEKFAYAGETMTVTINVKAVVDVGVIYDQILALRNDRDLQQKVKEQQLQISQMEVNIRDLQNKLSTNSPDLIQQSREQRKEVFGKISELEAVKRDIATKTKLAVENIELCMTKEEVERLIGAPRSKSYACLYPAHNTFHYNYGNVWIIFEADVVSAIIKSSFFDPYKDRCDYSHEAIIK